MIDVNELDWDKGDGLLPAIIQDSITKQILMLGYMNKESLEKTLETEHVTFFSRSKKNLWVKGETSGNYLDFVSAEIDCDQDTILIQATPCGPTCHTGTVSCFNNDKGSSVLFLKQLGDLIKERNKERPEGSYTTQLFEEGQSRIAQKVGEEGVELSLAHMKNDKEEILNESADLLFHTLVLLENADLSLDEVCEVLKQRHASK